MGLSLTPAVNAIPSVLSEKPRQRNCNDLDQAGWKQRTERVLDCPEEGEITIQFAMNLLQ